MERLTDSEVSLLALDTVRNPQHITTVHVFAGDDQFDHDDLVALVRDRLAFVPRYRQRLWSAPAGVAAPVWSDDDRFDLSFHLRRTALPRPGTDEQLREFVGRVSARRLDRSRPLWELYLVEGLTGNRFALVVKSHLALVDGIDNVELSQVLLDADPDAVTTGGTPWTPEPPPSPVDLLTSAVVRASQDPSELLAGARRGVTGLLGAAVAMGEATRGGVGGALGELATAALRGTAPAHTSPMLGQASEHRRFATVEIDLADLDRVRERFGHTVNDALLSILAGGLRGWLHTRGLALPTVVALSPMGVTEDAEDQTSAVGCRVVPHLAPLPTGEPSDATRLHQVGIVTQAFTDTGRAVAAQVLRDLAGFAPATLHALGARAGLEATRRRHDLVVTNVPGPQQPMYAAGALLEHSYPVLPLPYGQLLSIGVNSYDGVVAVGLNGDRDRITDIDVLAQCIAEARDEMIMLLGGHHDQQSPDQPDERQGVSRVDE
ncbi:wax ester/triacylglycerol synthase family O-acyltransferase [Propionibacteriaceae bacterium Y1700]|uniref:wax ester/triacylglycerol synthase family O-acyltransferase n=1 Tax=Microlunatus sp. Y1700 TaxID=3418487 RepID=UPI003DA71668